jgi:hypothetical protein
MCVCTSMPPGSTYLPVASIGPVGDRHRLGLPGRATAAIVSPSISTSPALGPVGLTTVPLVISVRAIGISRTRSPYASGAGRGRTPSGRATSLILSMSRSRTISSGL